MQHRKWSFFAVALLLVTLALTAGNAPVVSQADISYIKAKVEAGEPLSPDEIVLMRTINGTTSSRISIEESTETWRVRQAGSTAAPHHPAHSLDDYVWSQVTYDWVDISTDGINTHVGGDDTNGGPIPIGFDFPFYGQTYSTIRACCNGFLTFTSTSTRWTEIPIPNASEPNTAIYGFWDDLSVDTLNGQWIKYRYDANPERFVVSYSCELRNQPTTHFSYEYVLYPSGRILIQYQSVPTNVTSCVAGIENQAGDSAVQICYDGGGTVPAAGRAFLIGQQEGIPAAPTNLAATTTDHDVTLTWTDPDHDTSGNPLTPDSLLIFTTVNNQTQQVGHVGAGVQTFTHVNAPLGWVTYSVRAKQDLAIGAAVSRQILVGSPVYSEDFETNDGLWVADTGWQWGVPTNSGDPGQAHSGTHVWGVGLNSDYLENSCYHLDLDLGLIVNDPDARVEFWAWWDIESPWDGVNFKASLDNGETWTLIEPQGGYSIPSVSSADACIGLEEAWSGSSGSWQHIILPIGQYVGEAPMFRLTFGSDPVVQYTGFYFDDMVIWGLEEPVGATVSGVVTLDGGSGDVTQATVHANGLGNPSVHPNAAGSYVLDNVTAGNRMISVTLPNYVPANLPVIVPEGGITGVNITLRRTPPAVPTSFDAMVWGDSGVVLMSWSGSPDTTVDAYNIYNKIRDDSVWIFRKTVYAPVHQTEDTLIESGIYTYCVTAVDTNTALPHVESGYSRPDTILYGELPPQQLTADSYHDDHIDLSWLAPNVFPENEVYYDNGINGIQGYGWNGSQQSFAWWVARFHGTGPVTVSRIKAYLTSYATLGDPFQVALFADSTNGRPCVTPLGLVNDVQRLPLDVFKEWDVTSPVTFNNGTFYVGIRQMTVNSVCLGGDTLTPFINNTFYYATSGPWWSNFETSYNDIPMLRAFVTGNMGEQVEVAPGGPALRDIAMSPSARAENSPWAGVLTVNNGLLSNHENRKDHPHTPKPTTMVRWNVAEAERTARKQSLESTLHPEVHIRPVAVAGHGGHHALDDPDYYVIFRDGADHAHVLFPNQTFTDPVGSDHEGVPYSYYVKAHYSNGHLSGPTNTVTTAAHMPPYYPTNVSLAPVGLTQMRIQWINPTINADGTPCTDYAGSRLYRNGALITPTPIPASEHLFIDIPPHNDSLYTWTVRGVDEAANEGAGASAVGGVIGPWAQCGMEWLDISGIGNDAGIIWDDENVGPFDLGFDFPFYGQTYNSVRICDNGFVSFTSTSSYSWPSPIPSSDTWDPNCALYAFWDDLDISVQGGQILYHSDPALGQFVISWLGIGQWGMPGSYTFQIVIHADGSVIFNYLDIPEHGGCLVGVENEAGTDAYQLCYNGSGAFLPHDSCSVAFWRGPQEFVDVSGHVTLDGGSGNVTDVVVMANGTGLPSAHPQADGTYLLQDVQVGMRRLLFSLQGYDMDTLTIALDTNGATGVNDILRRSPPPVPTNVHGTVLTLACHDSLHWDVSPDPLADGYRVYRRLRDSTAWNLRLTVPSNAQNWANDTVETDGIYEYVVTTIDNDVLDPPIESAHSSIVTCLFGHLPPQMLVANANFDNKIRLNWIAPGILPEYEAYYDDSIPDTWIGWDDTPPFGWIVAHYQGNGSVRVTKIKAYIEDWATDGSAIQVGVFADDGTGWPTMTTIGVLDTVEALPFNEFKTWTLNPPVTVDNGSFFVGIRQTTWNYLSLGADMTSPFFNNTFFYSYSGPWSPFEPFDIMIPMVRCFVIGHMDAGAGDEIELQPSPVRNAASSGFSAVTSPVLQQIEAPVAGKFSTAPGLSRASKSGTPAVGPVRFKAGTNQITQQRTPPPIMAARGSNLNSAKTASHGHHHTLDDVVRYLIYRDPQTHPEPIDSVAPNIEQYDDTPLAENVQHTYYVKARYDDNALSPASNSVENIACNMAPGAPGNLTLTPIGLIQMRLNWTAPTTNADGTPCVDLAGFRIYRDGQLITPTPIPANVTVFNDIPPVPTSSYTWTVKAIDEVPNVGIGVSDTGTVQGPWRRVDYAWVDISTLGQRILNCDDCNEGRCAIGFPFTYYGNTYTTFRASSNGFIEFGGGDVSDYYCVPSPNSPNNAIFMFATNLNPGPSGLGQVRYYSDPANHRCTISWNGVPRYPNSGSYWMQIVLEEDGGVTFNYQTVFDVNGIVGVENATGSGIGLWCSTSGHFMPDTHTSARFWGGPRQAIMGNLRHAGGSNPPLANARVWVSGGPDTVWTNSTGQYVLPVEVGTYQLHLSHPLHCDSVLSNIVINSGDIDTVNVSLLTPNASTSASSLTFLVHRNQAEQQTFSILNVDGECPLSYSLVDSVPWLTETPTPGTVNPNESAAVTVTVTPGLMQPGEYHTTLYVICNVPESPHTIHVEMDVLSVIEHGHELPTVFALHPNFPNPFNPTTVLPFDVPQQSQVDIVVYNVMGQAVARPVSGVYAAGCYQATFAGDNLPSGLYFVKMTAGSFTSMGKMMLLK
jgi:hypothetical protein